MSDIKSNRSDNPFGMPGRRPHRICGRVRDIDEIHDENPGRIESRVDIKVSQFS